MAEKTITMNEKNLAMVTATQRTVQILVKVLVYAFLTIMAIIILLPFYWMINSSL
jgi:ABC-type glycerol-3-phosphate transport system permease component